MQFVKITQYTKLKDLISIVGDNNIDDILATNGLTRCPNIGAEYKKKYDNIVGQSEEASQRALVPNTPPVDWQHKLTILNSLSTDAEVFEEACYLDEDEWKVLSATNALPYTLRVPDGIALVDSTQIIGSSVANEKSISKTVYKSVVSSLSSVGHAIDSGAFLAYSTIKPTQLTSHNTSSSTPTSVFSQWFQIPRGEVMLYSSLTDSTMDIPCYPEELDDGVSANYDTMPDILYQYEPWQVYKSSGPRSNSYTFMIHRDMFSGNHLDGRANELIRFCEANCYPKYSGSAVHTSTVTLYIGGSSHISGVLTRVGTHWSGPIGQDKWYLVCELTLEITEVSNSALDFSTVAKKGLIG